MKTGFTTMLFGVLVLGVGVGMAFGGGVLYGRNTAPTAKAAAAPAATSAAGAAAAGGTATGGPPAGAAAGGTPGAGAGAAARAGGGGGGGGGAGGVTGAIDSVTSNTLSLRTVQGTVVNVALSSDTQIRMSTLGTVSDLRPGTIVTVSGQADASGTIPATAIQVQPLGPGAPSGTPRAGGGAGASGGQSGGQAGPGQAGARGTGTPSAGGAQQPRTPTPAP